MIYVLIAVAYVIGFANGFVVSDDLGKRDPGALGLGRFKNFAIRAAFIITGLIVTYTVCLLIRGFW